uniref:Immediate early response gene 2 protein n=1 Tax=Marmota marmota marmota TaxID=9994 RepID=A0A8C6A8A9_MARMA
MEVQKEAQRIMTLSVWKMYHSRMQRGGLRLHRSLQLSLVMRSARELYLSAKVEAQEPEVSSPPAKSPDPRLHPVAGAGSGWQEAPPQRLPRLRMAGSATAGLP